MFQLKKSNLFWKMSKVLFAIFVLAVICTSFNSAVAKPEADSVQDLELRESSPNREKRNVIAGFVNKIVLQELTRFKIVINSSFFKISFISIQYFILKEYIWFLFICYNVESIINMWFSFVNSFKINVIDSKICRDCELQLINYNFRNL